MSFRLVSRAGSASEVAVVQMYASGVVHPGGVVVLGHGADLSQGFVSTALSTSTQTQIFGICNDYAQGGSDTLVNVTPFVPGQLWEGDCINTVATTQIGKRFSLSTATTPERSRLLNNNSYDQSGMTGIFQVWQISSVTTGSGKVIGEFIRLNGSFGQNATTFN